MGRERTAVTVVAWDTGSDGMKTMKSEKNIRYYGMNKDSSQSVLVMVMVTEKILSNGGRDGTFSCRILVAGTNRRVSDLPITEVSPVVI